MDMTKNIVAVIPVRKGSERVTNKSTRKFCDTTLIDYKIQNLKKVYNIDRIVVATDCDICIDKSIRHNVDYIKRNSYYTSSTCSSSDMMVNLAEIIDADFFMYTPPTSPFISVNTYNNFIESFKSEMTYGHDSLTAVQRISSHAWYKNEPLNYKLEESSNSQELPKIDLIGYGLSLIIKDVIFETRNVIGKSPSFYTLDSIESIDINCIDEFKLAEYVYSGIKSELQSGMVI